MLRAFWVATLGHRHTIGHLWRAWERTCCCSSCAHLGAHLPVPTWIYLDLAAHLHLAAHLAGPLAAHACGWPCMLVSMHIDVHVCVAAHLPLSTWVVVAPGLAGEHRPCSRVAAGSGVTQPMA